MRTNLNGEGAETDPIGIPALLSLVDGLDAGHDQAAAQRAVSRWATQRIGASDVIIELGGHESRAATEIETQTTPSGASVITIVVPARDQSTLTITFCVPLERVTESLRGTLIIAGRLLERALARAGTAAGDSPHIAPKASSLPGARARFLGSSQQAHHVSRMIERLARSDVSVLIDGETGVGKSFVARLIHEASARMKEPLRIVNCSAIPESLVESQLFGYERGAFTGANSARMGLFEAAGSGTILLDEIGELPPASQAKLLHVLEERRFERVGSNRSIELRARVLCATNRNLDDMVRAAQFRRDLLFRISVVRLNVPPLRERQEDLAELAHRILANVVRSANAIVTGFTPDALQLLQLHSWPGNVRELRNAIEYAVALGDGPLIAPCDLPPSVGGEPSVVDEPDIIRLPSPLADVERRAIDASLRATNGNRLRAAELLGVTRQTLYNKLRVKSSV